MHQSDPYLSLVLTGRNDGYGGDFVTRFLRTLRFNHHKLSERGIAHEIVFVEWAPPSNGQRLIDIAFSAMPELESACCSWYVVDPQYQTVLSLNPRLAYLEFIAKNVGARRARGRFVLISNCDIYLGRRVLDVLAQRALRPEVLYRAPRHDIKLTVDHSNLDWDVLEDPRNLDGAPHPLKGRFMSGGTGDFMLLDRETFHSLGGFNEVYRVARIGIDRNFVVKLLSSGFSLEAIGGPVYHINHAGSYRLVVDSYAGREDEAHFGNRRWHSGGVTYVNPPTWGLERAPAIQRSAHEWYLDFCWDAVPPLVDLKRVVLPVSRIGGEVPGVYKEAAPKTY